ncbi:MAG: M16 family metallopeptidase [Maricaulaceae bacterium]
MSVAVDRLANGLIVAADPMNGLETVALGVWVKLGARWEPLTLNGASHLLEHMAFKGAGGRSARDIAQAVEDRGALLNAATSYERTSYHTRALADDVEALVDLLADILRRPHFDPDDFALEQDVVHQEIGEARATPDDYVFELFQTACFGDTPLGRPILGAPDRLDALTPQIVRAYAERHHRPDRLMLVGAGAVGLERLSQAAETAFGDWFADAVEDSPEPAQFLGGVQTEPRKTEQTHLVIGFAGPAADATPELRYAAHALVEILGGGMSSRLFQDVREARGLAYTIDAFLESYQGVGGMGIYAACASEKTGEVARLSLEALDALAQSGPTDAELNRAKAQFCAGWLRAREAPAARAETLAAQLHLDGAPTPAEVVLERLAAVEPEAVRAAAQTALAGPRAVAGLGPKRPLASLAGIAEA